MVKQWIKVVCAVLCALLPVTCRGEKEGQAKPREGGGETIQLPVEAVQPAVPEEALVQEQLVAALANFSMVTPDKLQMDAQAGNGGIVQIVARVLLRVQEDLYEKGEAPKIFDEDRKQINDVMNQAMLPDAYFLLQVGAEADSLTEADRAVKPLPQELQETADAIRELAQRPVYRLHTPADTVVEIPATLRASEKDGKWTFSDINVDTAPLQALQPLIPARELPQGAAIFSEGFENQVRTELREKMAAFCAAAQPYIAGREQAARESLLSQRMQQEEAQKSARQREEARAAWEKTCSELLYDAALYEGEWKRADSFGKFSLRIAKGKVFPEAFQFVGTLSDTDVPQAEMQVTGRAEPAKPGEPIPCIVRIFNGRYDPDVPTAEAFDAKDALMRLSLMPDGSLSGVLTCESWEGEQAEKAFQVQLHLVVPKKGERRKK